MALAVDYNRDSYTGRYYGRSVRWLIDQVMSRSRPGGAPESEAKQSTASTADVQATPSQPPRRLLKNRPRKNSPKVEKTLNEFTKKGVIGILCCSRKSFFGERSSKRKPRHADMHEKEIKRHIMCSDRPRPSYYMACTKFSVIWLSVSSAVRHRH